MAICLLAANVAQAYQTQRNNITVRRKVLHYSEQSAVQEGVAVEESMRNGTYKPTRSDLSDCYTRSRRARRLIRTSPRSFEIKKLYLEGVARYKVVLNATIKCAQFDEIDD